MKGTEMDQNEQGDRSPENASEGSVKEREPKTDKLELIIIYNGVKKPLKATFDEAMKALLDQAIALFGSLPNPHTLALFNEAGKELPVTGTVKEAGIKPGEKLLLRPSTVRGG
jgi:hypothetical protein